MKHTPVVPVPKNRVHPNPQGFVSIGDNVF